MQTTTKLVTPPVVEPISLSEAKLHCHVDGTDEDALLPIYITAARSRLERLCERALISQVWELALDSLAAQIELPYPPIISVDSIKYLDSSGTEQTIPPADYVLYDYGTVGHYVEPVTAWPATSGGIRITYTAGYGDTAADVPSDMKAWMLLAIGTMYANREQTSVVATYALPDSFYSDLIAHYLTQRA